MAEGTSSSIPSERQSDRYRGEEGSRGERSSGPREGGFRIRLSDNEMRSARALQEAFGLRSTVAVLGFALRTLGQQLEEGKLDELAAQHRAQMAQMGSRGGGGAGRPEGTRERPEGGRGGGGRWQEGRGTGERRAKIDPFARPSRPVAAPELAEEPSAEGLSSDTVEALPSSTESLETQQEAIPSDPSPDSTVSEAPPAPAPGEALETPEE